MSISRYIPELDGIRAIAVLLVVAEHMHTNFWKVAAGGFGVYVFFVLSGYLITSIALREESETGSLSLKAFYIRRTFRIFPLYYLVLGMYCLLIFGLGMSPQKHQMMARVMPYYLTYFQEVAVFNNIGAGLPVGETDPPFGQTWTLGFEEKFYLVWPAIAFLLLRRKRQLRLPVALGLAIAAVFLGKFVAPYSSILMGCALAILLEDERVQHTFRSLGSIGAYFSFSALVFVHFFVVLAFNNSFIALLYSFLVAVSLGFLLFVRTPANRILAFQPLIAIGKVSYGIYLIHRLCLNVAERAMHHHVVPSLLVTYVLSFGAAYVLHLAIETPLIRIGRKLAAKYSTRKSDPLIHQVASY